MYKDVDSIFIQIAPIGNIPNYPQTVKQTVRYSFHRILHSNKSQTQKSACNYMISFVFCSKIGKIYLW